MKRLWKATIRKQRRILALFERSVEHPVSHARHSHGLHASAKHHLMQIQCLLLAIVYDTESMEPVQHRTSLVQRTMESKRASTSFCSASYIATLPSRTQVPLRSHNRQTDRKIQHMSYTRPARPYLMANAIPRQVDSRTSRRNLR